MTTPDPYSPCDHPPLHAEGEMTPGAQDAIAAGQPVGFEYVQSGPLYLDPTSLVDWSVRTGRIAAASAPDWESGILSGERDPNILLQMVPVAAASAGQSGLPSQGDDLYYELYPEERPST